MDATLSSEQRELASSVAKILAQSTLVGFGERLDRTTWSSIAVQGFVGLHLPGTVGGGGGDVLDLAVVAHAFGRACAPLPYSTVSLALSLLHRAGGTETAELRSVLVGTRVTGIVIPDSSKGISVSYGRLTGVAGSVPFGDHLDSVLISLPRSDGGADVWEVESHNDGVEWSGDGSLDLSEPARRLCLTDAPATLIGSVSPVSWSEWVALARTVLAADILGTAKRAVDEARDYAVTREQFGRPIGSFQALKHALVNEFVELEISLPLVWRAAWSIDADRPEAPLLAAAAAAAAAGVAESACATALQAMGGIGFTWEHPAHRLLRRAMARRQWGPSEGELLESVARKMSVHQ